MLFIVEPPDDEQKLEWNKVLANELSLMMIEKRGVLPATQNVSMILTRS